MHGEARVGGTAQARVMGGDKIQAPEARRQGGVPRGSELLSQGEKHYEKI